MERFTVQLGRRSRMVLQIFLGIWIFLFFLTIFFLLQRPEMSLSGKLLSAAFAIFCLLWILYLAGALKLRIDCEREELVVYRLFRGECRLAFREIREVKLSRRQVLVNRASSPVLLIKGNGAAFTVYMKEMDNTKKLVEWLDKHRIGILIDRDRLE